MNYLNLIEQPSAFVDEIAMASPASIASIAFERNGSSTLFAFFARDILRLTVSTKRAGYLLSQLSFLNDEDYIFFSDPDEVPNPDVLYNFNLNKKYGIFIRKLY